MAYQGLLYLMVIAKCPVKWFPRSNTWPLHHMIPAYCSRAPLHRTTTRVWSQWTAKLVAMKGQVGPSEVPSWPKTCPPRGGLTLPRRSKVVLRVETMNSMLPCPQHNHPVWWKAFCPFDNNRYLIPLIQSEKIIKTGQYNIPYISVRPTPFSDLSWNDT